MPISSQDSIVLITFTVHSAQYVATDKTAAAPDTVVGVDLVLGDGTIFETISVSNRLMPGSFFDPVNYEFRSELYALNFSRFPGAFITIRANGFFQCHRSSSTL